MSDSEGQHMNQNSRRLTDYILMFLIAGVSGALPSMLVNKNILSSIQAHLFGWVILIIGFWLLRRWRKWNSLFG